MRRRTAIAALLLTLGCASGLKTPRLSAFSALQSASLEARQKLLATSPRLLPLQRGMKMQEASSRGTFGEIVRRLALPPILGLGLGLGLHGAVTGALVTHASSSLGMGLVEETCFLVAGLVVGIAAAVREHTPHTPEDAGGRCGREKLATGKPTPSCFMRVQDMDTAD